MKVVEKSTTEVVDNDVGTIKGVPTEGAGLRKPDPPSCCFLVLCTSGLLHLQHYLYISYALGTIACFFGVG